MQLGNLLATRTRKLSLFQQSPFKNPSLLPSMLASVSAAIIIVYVPFFQDVFETYPIPWLYWFLPIPFAASLLLLDEIRKLIVRIYPQSILATLAW
jgi:sodium/potassium-transporting ATPase subunit alpha